MPTNAKQKTLKDIIVRYDLQPGDIGKVVYLHAVIYAEEYGLDHTFEGYVASGLAEFAQSFNTTRASECFPCWNKEPPNPSARRR